jgi:hypothetical protein
MTRSNGLAGICSNTAVGRCSWAAGPVCSAHLSRGLALTTVVVVLIAAGWTVGAITQDVYGRDEPALVDPAVSSWFAAHHTTVADTVSEAILATVRWPWLVATIFAMAAAVGVWRGGRDGGRDLAGGVGAWAIVVALQQLLPTPASGAPVSGDRTGRGRRVERHPRRRRRSVTRLGRWCPRNCRRRHARHRPVHLETAPRRAIPT